MNNNLYASPCHTGDSQPNSATTDSHSYCAAVVVVAARLRVITPTRISHRHTFLFFLATAKQSTELVSLRQIQIANRSKIKNKVHNHGGTEGRLLNR